MQFVKRSPRLDFAGVLFIHVNLYLEIAQFSHDAKKPFHRNSQGARLRYFGLHGARNRHIQVGRGQFQFPFLSAEQDIGKNGEGGSRADDVLNGLQTIAQLFFGNREFHRGLTIAVLPRKKSILIKGCE